jgi:peptidoglycan/LPS O-acetylase OafA/YrhL
MPRARDLDPAANASIAARAHIPALDGLRGIAILLVIPHNADIFSNSAPWLWPIALLAHAGWIGVQLFFVLSGFLITRNLLDTRGDSNYLQSFYGRRVLRIFPLYFLTLFIGLIVLPRVMQLSAGALASHDNQIWLWTFLSNWAQPFGHEVSGFSHFWSLAVEEQFYLMWPFVVLFAAGTRLLWVCLIVVLLALLSRILMMQFGAKSEMLYMFTNCRMDALAMGAAAAVLNLMPSWMAWLRRNIRVVLLILFGALLGAALLSHSYAVYDPRSLTIGQSMLAAAFALLTVSIGWIPPRTLGYTLRRLLEMRLLRAVGRYSFAMYVFHLFILNAFGDAIRDFWSFTGSAIPLLYVLTIIGLSFMAGFISYHLLEKHFLRLKSYFPSRPRAGLAPL